MSEQYRGDDSFDRLEEMFGDDSALRDTMASLSDEMEWNERAALAAQYPGLFDEPRAYEEVDITATATEIHETFQKLCAEYSINPAHPDISPELLDEIDGELALAVYAMKKSIWSGDTIAVEDALVVDFAEMDDEEDGAPVVAVTTGQKLVGEFVAPGVGPLPDSVYALTDGEVDSAQVGVGLIMQNPRVVDSETGEVFRDMFSGNQIIVPLGTVGLRLTKYVFIDRPEL